MKIHACIRCDAPLVERSVVIGERTHIAWIRVCCETVIGTGWYWRDIGEPAQLPAPPPDPDDIPDSALDWSTPKAS